MSGDWCERDRSHIKIQKIPNHRTFSGKEFKSHRWDSNPRPRLYESRALSTELRWLAGRSMRQLRQNSLPFAAAGDKVNDRVVRRADFHPSKRFARHFKSWPSGDIQDQAQSRGAGQQAGAAVADQGK